MSYLRRLLGHEEEIVFSTRQHWTAFIGRCWRMFTLLLLTVIIAVGVNLELRAILDRWGVQPGPALRLGLVVALVFYPLLVLLVRYVRWRSEQYVVTNLRVIQLEGLLSKRVLDSSLEKLNDVMMQQSIFGRMLDYGDLEILTASELAVNKIERVARPLAFKAAMLDAKQRLEAGTRPAAEDGAKLIADLARLREQGILTDEEFQVKKSKLLAEL